MKNISSIFLIGFMGAGKTALGQALQARMDNPFYDSDQVIEAEMGSSVHTLFHTYGESWFRHKEAETIERLTCQPSIILATGGGAILDPKTRQYLNTRGLVLYLRTRPETLWNRIKHTANSRPLLQDEKAYEKMRALLETRIKFYEETAHTTVDTDNLTVNEITMRIISLTT